MKKPHLDFKNHFFSTPFGTLTKRELELKILQYAISTNIIDTSPYTLAKKLKISMTKSHSYLTDLALREEEISDEEALALFIDMLKSSEVVSGDTYLQCNIQNAKLRIWIELQLAQYRLLQGESIKRDLLKLTPNAVLSILKNHNKLPSNTDIDSYFKNNFKDTDWYKTIYNKNDKVSPFDWLSHLNTSAEAIKNIMQMVGN